MKDVLPWMSAASGQAFRVFISDDRLRLVLVCNYRAQIAGALPQQGRIAQMWEEKKKKDFSHQQASRYRPTRGL
jgi:hypothetical protein